MVVGVGTEKWPTSFPSNGNAFTSSEFFSYNIFYCTCARTAESKDLTMSSFHNGGDSTNPYLAGPSMVV